MRETGPGTTTHSTTIVVASTFTADPLAPALEFWFRQLNVSANIKFAPFEQVFQQLLDPSSLFSRNANGANVVLLRLEDWLPQLERNVADFVRAINPTRQSAVPLLICLCAKSPSALKGPDAALLQETQKLLQKGLENLSGVHLVTDEELQALYPVAECHDSQGQRLARIPYTPEYFSALATMIARKICALGRAPYKVIVLDCDQTLWGGVCGEDGPSEVQIRAEDEILQRFMIHQQQEGMLLCLCSKNNEDDVLAVFQRHPKMLMTAAHLADRQIDWKPKSENLKILANRLNLGLEAFIFVDDDPVECAEVRTNCPQVLSLLLPRGPDRVNAFLRHVWPFDRLATTKEGKSRTVLYQQQARRDEFQRSSLTFQDFIDGLDLNVRIARLSDADRGRAAELTYRTNQFNLTGLRRSDAELRSICETGQKQCFSVHASDRFGDYGLIGLLVVESDGECLRTDTFLLSCRAMGKGIEHRMLAKLGELAFERGVNQVQLSFVPTPKNSPARDFLHSLGSFGEGQEVTLPATTAAQTKYQPGSVIRTTAPAAFAESVTSSSSSSSAIFNFVAEELDSTEKIHRAIANETRVSTGAKDAVVQPRTPMEQKVAAVWADILGVEAVGIHDSFFELGGHSLLAMQVLARLSDAFGVELPPSLLFFGEFTVAGLTKSILSEQLRDVEASDLNPALNKLSGLSDDEVKALLDASKGEKGT